ncbi:MAG: TPMT family class I SAM-dependent methyltransferase [Schleiferiaceae bacterium]|nr:TPMT family class I SAM-dependent methyltransferase [Schleiferiaceae bacterium]
MEKLDASYWEGRWQAGETSWNIGYASPAIVNFAVNTIPKDAKILLPGAGNAYEAEALMKQGYQHLSVLDFSATAKSNFLTRFPDFPEEQFFQEDFFGHKGSYDYILEQTFFCALPPKRRAAYVQKMHELLNPKGILSGLLFQFPLTDDGPPFGGSASEYEALFSQQFHITSLHTSQESIPPRQGKELWFTFQKR